MKHRYIPIFLCAALAVGAMTGCSSSSDDTQEQTAEETTDETADAVSYTHLDVYKRQGVSSPEYSRVFPFLFYSSSTHRHLMYLFLPFFRWRIPPKGLQDRIWQQKLYRV